MDKFCLSAVVLSDYKNFGVGLYINRTDIKNGNRIICIAGRFWIHDEREAMNRKKEEKEIEKASITGALYETAQRYGSANKEHLIAYSGVDYENDKKLARGLKQIAEYKINPEYKSINYKQQTGFSAEIKEVANSNAENIINRLENRKIRTDDLGRVNDQIFDFMEVDAAGNVIQGSGIQMKFVGSNPKEALNKLASSKYEKYLNNNAKLEVPMDYYDGILKEADNTINNIKKQLENQRAEGNIEQVKLLEKRLKKYQKIKLNLKKSSLSNNDAKFARESPKLSTAKSVAKISHRAGMDAAEIGAAVGGGISIIKNAVALAKGEEGTGEALKSIAKDTTLSSAFAYGSASAGSVIKGLMQNASSETICVLSKTNLPAVMVDVAVSMGQTMKRYYNGEIDGIECLENLGEQGTGKISAAMFAVVGQAAIPIPVVGGMIGGMLGYAVSSASYGVLMNSLKDAKLAHEERRLVEKECEEQIKLIKEYRLELEEMMKKYFNSNMVVFQEAFQSIKTSLQIGDIDGFISQTNTITKQLGGNPQFTDFNEFNAIMDSSEKIIL